MNLKICLFDRLQRNMLERVFDEVEIEFTARDPLHVALKVLGASTIWCCAARTECNDLSQLARSPLAMETGEARLAGKELLHSGLFEVALLDNQLVQRAQQRAEQSDQVFAAEVLESLERAREQWKSPEPIPRWCCDGLHSAGDDVRFMGVWFHMYAACLAFEHYGRLDPKDNWIPDFYCYDGLSIAPELPPEVTLEEGQG